MQPPGGRLEALTESLWALLPAVLIVFLGFEAGGFFAGTTGLAAATAAVLLAVRILTTEHPGGGLTVPGSVAVVGVGCYAAFTLLSGTWSHAPARALIAFDRAVLYLCVVALFCAAPTRPDRLRTLIRGLGVGTALVCGAGLLSRMLPHAFPVGAGFLNQRLSYPITYWNTLGMLAALGIACCVHLASDAHERTAIRVSACALLPGLAATLLFTFSRGSIASLVVMLLIYAAIARRRRLLSTAIAVGPPTAIAVRVAYSAGQLARPDPTTPAAVVQGHHVALIVGACMVAAGALGLLAGLAERRLPPARLPRWTMVATIGACVACAIAATAVLDVPGWLQREYHRFVTGDTIQSGAPARARLVSVANNGRLELWRVAVRGFRGSPLRGHGAGTFPLLWQHDRPSPVPVENAHSLYLETLDELGAVGLLLLVAPLIGLLAGAARRLRPPGDRNAAALAVAAFVAWALHAGADWDWQMPVLTAPVLALVAAAGVRRRSASEAIAPRRAPRLLTRLALAACCLALAVVPALVAVSQANLDRSVRALDDHRCGRAIADARAASDAVRSRPEPFEVIGYCEARRGMPEAAQRSMRSAIARDPSDWEFRYGLAITLAAGGHDPHHQLEIARRLDPREGLIAQAFSAFGRGGAAAWRRTAAIVATDVP